MADNFLVALSHHRCAAFRRPVVKSAPDFGAAITVLVYASQILQHLNFSLNYLIKYRKQL